MIICLKGVSEEGFWLNCNFKIIKASIKFITKVYTQKVNSFFIKIKYV